MQLLAGSGSPTSRNSGLCRARSRCSGRVIAAYGISIRRKDNRSTAARAGLESADHQYTGRFGSGRIAAPELDQGRRDTVGKFRSLFCDRDDVHLWRVQPTRAMFAQALARVGTIRNDVRVDGPNWALVLVPSARRDSNTWVDGTKPH